MNMNKLWSSALFQSHQSKYQSYFPQATHLFEHSMSEWGCFSFNYLAGVTYQNLNYSAASQNQVIMQTMV